MKRIISHLRVLPAAALFAVLLGGDATYGAAGAAGAGAADDGPPPVPPGYADREAAVRAVQSGEVAPVNLFLLVPPGVVREADIVYGRGGGRDLELDLYRPASVAAPGAGDDPVPVPGVVLIHGGGWSGGKRADMRYYAIKLAERGYAVASISYRLSREASFPAAVHDAKCAVRWMRANAGRYGVDPGRIAAMGNSAGGHLALMLGYSAGHGELEGEGGHAGESSAVQAVVDFYGPYDLTTDFAKEQGAVHRFMGGWRFEEAEADYRLGSPRTHLKAGAPPTLVLHGTTDRVVPVAQSDRLAQHLEELGVPHQYVRLEGWPHAMDVAQPVNDHCFWHIARFLDRHLGSSGRPSAVDDLK